MRAWPFAVREYDPDLLHDACVRRRKLARQHLEALVSGNTTFALDLYQWFAEEEEGKGGKVDDEFLELLRQCGFREATIETDWPGVKVEHRCRFMGLKALAR